jgi:transcriptional regulator with XRE-family HTH domain
VLHTYRTTHKLKQHELADLLGYDQSYVSLIERGHREIRDAVELRRIAAVLGLPEDELGLLPVIQPIHGTDSGTASKSGPQEALDDQRRWRMAIRCRRG